MDQSMAQQLRIEQKQQLILSAGMLQSLEILRMPLWELKELISQSISENPLLEFEEADPAGDLPAAASPPPQEDTADDEAADVPSPVREFDSIWKTAAPEGLDPLALQSREISFADLLLEQIGTQPVAGRIKPLCQYLVYCLNRRGYLAEDPRDIAEELGVPLFDVMQALYLLQSLSPAGVGAQNLQECLILQLAAGPHFNSHTIRLVKEGLPLLAQNNLPAITKLLGTDKKTAQATCDTIRGLNPIPSQGYYTGETAAPVIPDAVIEREGDVVHITMNDRVLPRLELNTHYCQLLEQTSDAPTKEYLQAHLQGANTLIHSVQSRGKTLVRILGEVVRRQPRYFLDGQVLEPMLMSEIAEALDLHTSTVSRAVQGKYISCAGGVVALKSLFSAGIRSQSGSALAPSTIKARIQKLIDAEAKSAPLSDEDIRSALQLSHIELSRRTVAKYREEMGIPASSGRRR